MLTDLPRSHVITAGTVNDGSFLWAPPPFIVEGSNYEILIASVDDPSVRDSSDRPFSIVETATVPGITVLAPNGGESFEWGDVTEIAWTSTDVTGLVDITLRKGAQQLLLANDTANDGSFNWTVQTFLAPGSDYIVEVASVDDPAVLDISNAPFNVLAPPADGTITVLSPNGGEVVQAGTPLEITWSTTGVTGDWVFIRLIQDLSVPPTRATTIALNTENDGSFIWDVPPIIKTLVKLTRASHDSSAAHLLVAASAGCVTKTRRSPLWLRFYSLPALSSLAHMDDISIVKRSSETITWASTGDVGNVCLILHEGELELLVSASTPDDGAFDWEIPAFLPATEHYWMQVISIVDPAVQDASDDLISIVPPVR